ncbi:MAG: argininosuccinate lyase, partial [Clostridia bacterium]|nr:argininosuccinate lyase [Clostridia bacterium]
MKLWEGRFAQGTAADADAFNECLSFDKKLYAQDIRGSIAHATMLGKCGIISETESKKIVDGLRSIYTDIENGSLEVAGYEDIHSFVETTLVSRIGDTGKKLHTARSRNDQVATDFRLYILDSVARVKAALFRMTDVLLEKAKGSVNDI